MSVRPHFSSVILKLTSFCNLDCSYCYMFNLAVITYLRVPNYMPLDTAVAAVSSHARHVQEHHSTTMSVVLHGGEPALWPIDNFRALFAKIRALRSSGMSVGVSLQTNGLRIDHELVDLLIE